MKSIKPLLVLAVLFSAPGLRAAEPLPPIRAAELAERVLNKGLAEIDLGLFSGSLLLQGMSELALVAPTPERSARTIGLFRKFPTKEINGRGSFISHEVGGSGVALLRLRDVTHELDAQVAEAAKRMVEK